MMPGRMVATQRAKSESSWKRVTGDELDSSNEVVDE
jgi:hypothetical protein